MMKNRINKKSVNDLTFYFLFINLKGFKMAKKSLAELAAAFSEKNTSQGGGGDQNWKKFFPFWKAPVDSVTTFRFLPDADKNNDLDFLVENLTHELTINGKREKVACAKMYNEDCPICALSAKYYDEKSPDHNKTLGKKYYRKKSYIGQGIVIETPVEHDQTQVVKLVEFGPQVFTQITAGFASGDLEEVPYALKGGHNFRFRKTQTGDGQNSYITSTFQPKQTDVGDDIVEKLDELMYKLADYRAPRVEKSVLEAMLVAEQTGSSYSSSDDGDAPAPASAPLRTAPNKATEAEQEKTDDVPAAPAGKKLSVVEELKRRAAEKAAKAAAE